MKYLLSLTALIVASSCSLFAQSQGQQQIDSIQREVLQVLNTVRNDPQSFIPAIERYRTHVRSFTKSVKALDAAVKEIKAQLKKERPLPLLNMQGALQSAAEDHASDITSHDVMGHIGSDGSDPLKRVNTYGQINSLGEAITYGHNTPELIIASFLVDEGTPDRGHRKNLLNPTYTLVGIAIGTHSTYGRACVIVLGAPL
ncbi:MAG: CAP domain-containing protein [Candidatus Kapabacteria bacterium]|nr:CAP domain-containing protein [Candidatus Kapabacteria bacterium]